ncbi:hypothetical protein ACH444_34880, partial [Streptomyces microflavus]
PAAHTLTSPSTPPITSPTTNLATSHAKRRCSISLPYEICQALDDVSAPVHRYPDQDWSTL